MRSLQSLTFSPFSDGMGDVCHLIASREGEVLTLDAGGVLDAAGSRDLQRRLLEELSPEHDVVLRVDGVERIDLAGLQLLLATNSWLSGRGCKLTIVAGEGPALRALDSSGAAGHLEIQAPGVYANSSVSRRR